MTKDIKVIADHFGARKQLAKMIEECGELIEAVNVYHDDIAIPSDPVDAALDRIHVIEEMTDVQILIDQLTYLLHAREDMKQMREFKINRTLERVRNGYYE